MASNGLERRATNGKCHICYRVRNTDKYLKTVGEVRHGYATGYVWECKDRNECVAKANQKIDTDHKHAWIIKIALDQLKW